MASPLVDIQIERIIESSPVIVLILLYIAITQWRKMNELQAIIVAMIDRMAKSEADMTNAVQQVTRAVDELSLALNNRK